MTSEIALRDVNTIPESERLNGRPSNGIFAKPQVDSTDGKAEVSEKKKVVSLADPPIVGNGVDNSVVEVVSAEVEYVESENLKDVEDLDNCLKTLVSGLGSKDWVTVCDSLNDVRRLCIFHKEAITDMSDVVSLIVKSLKNPRSAVCKTAIMTCADLFKAYKDDIIDSVDPMLVQLLLKSSQDKKFVCEAAMGALVSLTSWVSPLLLFAKLQPHIKHKNPRIRAKASMCISLSVPRLGVDGVEAFGLEKLIQIGATQLSDQLPESRDAARSLLLELHSTYEKSHVPEPTAVSEEPPVASWEDFCQSKLTPFSAQAVLRVTNAAREGAGASELNSGSLYGEGSSRFSKSGNEFSDQTAEQGQSTENMANDVAIEISGIQERQNGHLDIASSEVGVCQKLEIIDPTENNFLENQTRESIMGSSGDVNETVQSHELEIDIANETGIDAVAKGN